MFAATGYVSVRVNTEGGYDVTVWDDDLAAGGQTSSEYDVVDTMRGWQEGMPARSLGENGGYLTAADETNVAEAVEALWHLLLRHGDECVREILVAAAGNGTLRGLRPWTGHSSLYLLHRSDRVGATRRGLVFHPAEGAAFQTAQPDVDRSKWTVALWCTASLSKRVSCRSAA